jgi:caffeoyl-CoA O-methyltransferase
MVETDAGQGKRMSSHTIDLTDKLHAYLLANGTRESDVAAELRAHTLEATRWHVMQISPEQGAFMQFLVRLIGAKRTLEVGTFTGYSALVVAEALPDDGKVVACDVSDEWTSIGRPFWERAGVAAKIDLHLRPAVETLDELIDSGHAGSFDFAFIDADKANYDAYYERSLALVRTGGVIGIDNVLWGGRVAKRSATDEDTQAIRALNAKVQADARVDLSVLPVGDGLTLARKR